MDTIKRIYNVDNPMQNDYIRNKALITRRERYSVNCVMTSSQQIYLSKLYSGELNYPVNGYYADIMFLDEKIFCEYSGSGHNICVKYQQMSIDEFLEKEEQRRLSFLRSGFKEFEICSTTDVLPSDNKLMQIKNKAFEVLNNGCNYYRYNIDTNEEFCK